MRKLNPLLVAGLIFAMALAAPCLAQVNITAKFSDDAVEDTDGVFIRPNVAPVTPAGYAQLRFLMRPVRLTASGVSGTLILDAMGDPILDVYLPGGIALPLPAMIDADSLPQQLFVNAKDRGTAILTLAEAGPIAGSSSDAILFRSGHMPGLAGTELGAYPFFDFITAINEDDIVQTALDPVRHAERVGLDYDVYIVRHRSEEEWSVSNVLIDESGAIETATVTAGGIEDNIVVAWASGLSGAAGTGLGVAYDVVYDFGMDGTLDPGDLLDGFRYNAADVADASADGYDFDEAGFYIVHDLTQPGPFATSSVAYNGGSFKTQKTFYPTDIANMGKLKLVQISHGNGHNYNWYDYLQSHLASYGYIAMSHQNNTVPGPEAASVTTLSNLEYLLANQSSIQGGIFDGHIDETNVIWIGHSRGGEGVARAYDKLFDGAYSPGNFTIESIRMVSSIAPTDFLGTLRANPHDVPYHMLQGAADGDVCGCPNNDIAQALHLLDRANGFRQMTYVHGADHNDFNCCGFNDFNGPPGTEIGRQEAQRVAKGAYLALVKRYFEGNVPSKDFIWRQYESLKPISVSPNTTVVNMYKEEGKGADTFVIDDYQANTATNTSSSGGGVTFDVANLIEGRLNDNNASFAWLVSDPFNGMTYANNVDTTFGSVFDYTADSFLEYEIVAAERDLSDDEAISLRACQGTRHPRTVARLGDLTFTVTLRDGNGTTSSINIGVYGGGLEEPYQRTGFGGGAGWQNEFETVRIRLTDFEANGSGIDLSDIEAVRLDLGPSFGDAQGRIGIDDVEIYRRSRTGER